MSAVPKPVQRITPEDLLKMPDNNTLELIDGVVLEKPVSRMSSKVGGRILYLIAAASDADDRVEIYGPDLGYRCFPEDSNLIRKPDVSVIARTRLADLPDDVGYMPIAADLAVEVVSPNDLYSALSLKVRLYLDSGFPQVWIVDIFSRTCNVFTPDAPGRILRESDVIEIGPTLPTFRCRVAEFFVGVPINTDPGPSDE